MYKLGKLKPKYDKRTLQFAKYVAPALSFAPQTSHWENAPPLGMLMNDTLGDCTIAAILHNQRIWSKANGVDYTPTDAEALQAYEIVGGYDPSNPSTDNGCACLDVLNYAQKKGVGGRKIGPFVQIDVSNHSHVQHASYWFGGLYIGIDMPACCQDQPNGWSVPKSGLSGDGTPGSWGGHCTSIAGYSQKELDVITWGERIPMTWGFWDAYVTECYAILSNDFVVNPNRAPNGFNMTQLIADLKLI